MGVLKTVCLLGLVGLAGCSAEHWTGKTTMRTELRGPGLAGFHFIDTKDNDIEISDARFDPSTNLFVLGKLTVRNNSSDPIRAEIGRIEAIGLAQMSQVAYLNGVMQGLIGLVGATGKAAGGFSWLQPPTTGGSTTIPTPWGPLGSTTDPGVPWVAPSTNPVFPSQPQMEAILLSDDFVRKFAEALNRISVPVSVPQPTN